MEQITVEQALSYTRAGDKERIAHRLVKKYHYSLDIKHKDWERRGLMPPIEPDEIAQYSFSDLQLSVYTQIII